MNEQTAPGQLSTVNRPRLWPLYLVLAVQAAAFGITVTPAINNFVRFAFMMLGPLVCSVLFLVWLLFASRLWWRERLAIASGILAAGFATSRIMHESMGVSLWIYGVPLALVMVAVAVTIGAARSPNVRTSLALFSIASGWSLFALFRLQGFDGSYWPELRWRWQPTQEDLLATRGPREMASAVSTPLELSPTDWPGFRGARRNSRVENMAFRTDLGNQGLEELWRIPIGPAWSSFIDVGGRAFTQEQRNESELIVCYETATGREIWRYESPSRFTEVVSGPGPRATPTFADGKIFALGAKSRLTCLDAASGQMIWQRDLMDELDAPLPQWGFSSSPLFIDGYVIVYAGGKDDHGLVAYKADTGTPAWHTGGGGMNYGSAQLALIDGEELVLFADSSGLLGIVPRTGKVLWRFTPKLWKGPAMVQPQQISDHGVIVPLGDGVGLARLEVALEGDRWSITEGWTSRQLKPSFNDFVYHDGYLYGFDQNIFTCIDAANGKRQWKQGRYGFGQVLLLEQSAALIVMSESGDVVILAADPNEHRELGRVAALNGKTWNHPAVSADRLFVRNGEQAVCYRLPSLTE